jgi:hypothetical protein
MVILTTSNQVAADKYYTAKITVPIKDAHWGTGDIECENTTLPNKWYKNNGRCGEDGGINYWNYELMEYRYNATTPDGASINCNDSSVASGWYEEKGRCGDQGGIDYWNSLLASMPEDEVKKAFDEAYTQSCIEKTGTSNSELCNDRLLCRKTYGDEYLDNTNICEPVAGIKQEFEYSYHDVCLNRFDTTDYEMCNDRLLCDEGDDYIRNTNQCKCTSTDPDCDLDTYVGTSCWDGCEWLVGIKPYECTGTRPANTSIHSGDTTSLTANTPWTYSATNTTPKCQYYCRSGYTWNGSLCRLNAACGSANGGSYCNAPPTEDLCANGSPSTVTSTSGNWTWTCSSVSGTTQDDASCSATVQTTDCGSPGNWQEVNP